MTAISSSITETMEEYRDSKRCLTDRIQELNRKLAARGRRYTGGELKELAERRRRLYAMIHDLDLALRLMGEYIAESNFEPEKGELAYAG